MKILFRSGDGAIDFMRQGYHKVFQQLGYQCAYWNGKTPAFDVFNEFEPDIVFTGSYQVDRATLKCMQKRKNLKIILWCPNYGVYDEQIRKDNDPVLIATDEDKRIVRELKKTNKLDYVFTYYHNNEVEDTHGDWKQYGVKPIGLLMAADIFDYHIGTFRKELECDAGIVSGFWPYKGTELQKYIVKACHPQYKLNIKIFGNGPWPVAQHLGMIETPLVKDLFVSSVTCPNIFEPLSVKYGFDLNERSFKILSSGGFCLCQNIRAAKQHVFKNNEVVFFDDSDDFIDKIKYYKVEKEERAKVIENGVRFAYTANTYHHRMQELLKLFDLPKQKELDEIVKGFIKTNE